MKEIFIERTLEILRIAVKENNILMECLMEEANNNPFPGQIYKGIVKNIVPAIKCAFIDIGYKKNAYMYLDAKMKNKEIKKGQEVLVQVIKEDMENKGPKVTNWVTLPGRNIIFDLLNKGLTFSRKISNEEFKKYISENLKIDQNIAVKIRTSAENTDISLINKEYNELYKQYETINKKFLYSTNVGAVFNDGGIIGRILRDKVDENTSKIYLNNLDDYESVKNFIDNVIGLNIEVIHYEGERTLFDNFGIEKDILNLRNDRVYLNCGGYIVINKTEALYAIDVNSGKNIKGSNIQKTALVTNLQAAKEIARQVKLRNLSGIIIVDFIDMTMEEHKTQVMNELINGFSNDKNKTTIYNFTQLNLVQIARKMIGKSITEYIEENCSSCHGKGKKMKFSYLSMLIKNEVLNISNKYQIKDILIEIDEKYKKELQDDVLEFIKNIHALDKTIYVNFINSQEHFKVEPLLFSNQIENAGILKIYG
ncbi:MAG: ribonuclease [Clostridiaceae bacterium]|jgi:ribonuclease G|nr:ribonuclease [Clostridiaceae bacterium]